MGGEGGGVGGGESEGECKGGGGESEGERVRGSVRVHTHNIVKNENTPPHTDCIVCNALLYGRRRRGGRGLWCMP